MTQTLLAPLALAILSALPADAGPITTPKAFFGFDMGEDYCLANYTQLQGYWAKLAAESDRIKVVEIGTTAEGRPSARGDRHGAGQPRPAGPTQGHLPPSGPGRGRRRRRGPSPRGRGESGRLDRRRHPRDRDPVPASPDRDGLPGSWRATTPRPSGFLDDVIILFVHANPDGHDLVADWYMREQADPTKRTLAGLPTALSEIHRPRQ